MKIKLLRDTAYQSGGVLKEGKAGDVVEADPIAVHHLIAYRLAEMVRSSIPPPTKVRETPAA